MQKYEAAVATGPTIVPKKLDGTGKKEVCTRKEGGWRREKGERRREVEEGWREEGKGRGEGAKHHISRASPEAMPK
jgi:hypothetical protein